MQSPYLDRIRRWRRGAMWIRWCLALATAVCLCALTLLCGVAVHRLVERDAGVAVPAPDDLLLGRLLASSSPLPVAGWSLLQLCGAMAACGLLLSLLWRLQAGNGQAEATDALRRLQELLYRRATSPLAADILAPQSQAERLLSRREPIRRGLLVYWQQAPRCQAGAAALLLTALLVDPWLTLLGALLAVGAWWRFHALNEQASERAQAMRGKVAKSESLLLESLRMAPLQATLQMAEPPGEPFQQNLRLHAAGESRAHALRATLGARAVALITAGASVLFAVFCVSGRVPLSVGVTVVVALLGAGRLTIRLLGLRGLITAAEDAAGDVLEFIDHENVLPRSSAPRGLTPLKQAIRLEGVAWEDRRGRRVLTDATCEIPAGQLTAILSSDEGAPAAVAAMVSRLNDPLEGRVLYDDADIRGAELADVRRQISIVSARPLLFTGTVLDNILCGQTDLSDQVETAAKQCGSWEVIQDLPQGMSTLVGPLGLDLPPSATFLVMLTRAVVRNPSLLIVEEPPEGAVLSAVAAAAEHRAVLLIPSSIESLRMASQVLLLHQGQVQDVGKHGELIQQNDLYRHLNYMRFNPYQNAGSNGAPDDHISPQPVSRPS